jgi:hypothetical protein
MLSFILIRRGMGCGGEYFPTIIPGVMPLLISLSGYSDQKAEGLNITAWGTAPGIVGITWYNRFHKLPPFRFTLPAF